MESAPTIPWNTQLQERHAANMARAAFDNAIAAAKAEIPPIRKNRKVDFNSAKGRTTYEFEDLAEIVRTVDPILSRHGLSYRFRTHVSGQNVEVICILSHRDGHSEETSLPAQADNSGSKNAIQAVGSTLTYLQRYLLKAALGLAVSSDDDARAAAAHNPVQELTARQAAELRSLIQETATDEAKFLAHAGAQSVEEIDPRAFPRLQQMLLAKRRTMASAAPKTAAVEDAVVIEEVRK
ncbi:ERF family protein [Cereibacter azotoformans]|uniref:ERF family protein n=1 Tax=Cereibacter azotoformans TaxID=43057 RepID=UPI001EEC6618|nr:ERF family protein [Cereibacter azotoformans]ULB09960.1 ERF family protein [Cereibacter azotoformans]